MPTTTAQRPTAPIAIERSMPFTIRSGPADGGDGLTISGLAAVFGQKTRIDSWEGMFDESIRKGAFAKTLKERSPVMQFDHGRHPLIGSIPIGSFNTGFPRESDAGVEIEGRLLDNWLIQPVRDAVANQTVNGMSFRFEVVRDEWSDKRGKVLTPQEISDLLWKPDPSRGVLHRELIEVRCPEMGPVVFPAYPGTSVDVRANSLAYEIRSQPEVVRKVRAALATGSSNTPVFMEDGKAVIDKGVSRDVAYALLFPDNGDDGNGSEREVSERDMQIARIRSAWEARSLTPDESTTLTGLLVQLAAADAALDPFCDALCSADCALDDAQTIIASMLGLPDPDPEDEMDDSNPAGMGANSVTDNATPRDDAPGNDAPPVKAPVQLTPSEVRAKFLRDAYMTRNRVGKVIGTNA